MAKSYKGLYRPTNPKKYVGDPNRIVYRSLLERRFMLYCDRTTDIIAWASEELAIKYYNPLDKKVHRYFPDFIVKTAKDKKYIIEIKPYKQTLKPKVTSKKTKWFMKESFEYIKNTCKWEAATEYAKDNGYEFKIITEKELGIYN